jgi:hypothetical protein
MEKRGELISRLKGFHSHELWAQSRVGMFWFLVFLTFFAVMQFSGWPLIEAIGYKLNPEFADLRVILLIAECANLGTLDPSKNDGLWVECGYIYGSTLVDFISLIGLSSRDTVWLGWTFISLMCVLFAFMLTTVKIGLNRYKFVALLTLVSPPMMLLLERANFDVLIVALVAFAAVASANGRKITTFTLIAASTLFKFYTLPLLILVSMDFDKVRKKLIALGASLAITIIIALDLLKAQVDIPRTIWASFGNSFLGLYLQTFEIRVSILFQNLFGVLFLALILFITNIFGLQKIVKSLPSINIRSFWVKLQMYFMLVFISCYFGGMSFDYRLIFLFIPCLIELKRISSSHLVSYSLQILLLISAWFSLSSGRLQPIGDIAIAVLIVYFLMIYSFNFTKFGRVKSKDDLRDS